MSKLKRFFRPKLETITKPITESVKDIADGMLKLEVPGAAVSGSLDVKNGGVHVGIPGTPVEASISVDTGAQAGMDSSFSLGLKPSFGALLPDLELDVPAPGAAVLLNNDGVSAGPYNFTDVRVQTNELVAASPADGSPQRPLFPGHEFGRVQVFDNNSDRWIPFEELPQDIQSQFSLDISFPSEHYLHVYDDGTIRVGTRSLDFDSLEPFRPPGTPPGSLVTSGIPLGITLTGADGTLVSQQDIDLESDVVGLNSIDTSDGTVFLGPNQRILFDPDRDGYSDTYLTMEGNRLVFHGVNDDGDAYSQTVASGYPFDPSQSISYARLDRNGRFTIDGHLHNAQGQLPSNVIVEGDPNVDGTFALELSENGVSVVNTDTGETVWTTVPEPVETPETPPTTGRRLQEVNGTVEGDTAAAAAQDASAERVGVLWQAMMAEVGDQPPNLSAENALAFITGVYLGPDATISDDAWTAFYAANIGADGTLSDDLDLTMFPGVDPETMSRAIMDASGLFYSAQQAHIRAASGPSEFDADALTLPDDPVAAQNAFLLALRNDKFQTGTSDYLTNRVDTGDADADAITNSTSQDFSVVGISSDAITNGLVTEDDLANHAGVKALLFTGNEVMQELIEKGLWDGPSLEQLDSAELLNNPEFAVYEVTYTYKDDSTPVTRLVTKAEYEELQQQHRDRDITLQSYDINANFDPNDDGASGTYTYDITYLKEDGTLETVNGVLQDERDRLVDLHNQGKITILKSPVENQALAKVFWAQRALSVYDATRVQVYDESGNVTSGQSAIVRLAQNYYQQYNHFESATDTFDFHNRIGRPRTGTRIDPLLNTDPLSEAPSISDGRCAGVLVRQDGAVV